jgi:hypothetical protein
MALLMLTWDLPPEEKLDLYSEKAMEWVSIILKQEGIKEFRAYRNPYSASPQVMVHQEYDSMESCMKYINSGDYNKILAEMRDLGCSNITMQFWGGSPIIKEPLRPPKG